MAVPRRVHEAQQSKPPHLSVVPPRRPTKPKRKRTPDEKDRRARLRMLRSNSLGSRRYLIGEQIKRAHAFRRDPDPFSDASYDWLCMTGEFVVELLRDVHAARRLLGRETRPAVEGMIESLHFSDERTMLALVRVARAFKERESECRKAPGWSWISGWSDGSSGARILHFGKPADLFLDVTAVEAVQGKPFRGITPQLDAEQYANAFRGALAAIYDLRPAAGTAKP